MENNKGDISRIELGFVSLLLYPSVNVYIITMTS